MMESDARQAWDHLESRLRPFVERRVGSAADADDVLQDVFVRMQRGLAAVRDEERFAAWIFQIARHVITDHHRAAARLRALDAAPEPVADDEDLASEGSEALRAELAECVGRFVALLEPTYRDAIAMTELGGRSQKDAAEALGMSHSGMKSRVQRGRAQLREMFDRCCAIELDARSRVVGCEPRGCPPDRVARAVRSRD